ncbi:MAG: PhnD/SsuA/transferrin family substrate-binding protein [Rhodobacteraceae bacterium]|jgi:ABC-type phosphate/phosphonate transport system substrate-binding protein|nr:PhnD/SsuA/transferrin family substrate-binding protein [Paracoccaceae bacterium]
MTLACLPMYDWPEARAETLATWQALRDGARARGAHLPDTLTDPGPDGVMALWRSPALVFGQTCWGPLSLGLIEELLPLAQPDYGAFEGGRGPFYRSALVSRGGQACVVPEHPGAALPADLADDLREGLCLAFNSCDSLSGYLALKQDLGADPAALAIRHLETGSHRASVVAVAEGRADLAAIDCRSWDLARRFEPCARGLAVVGWTAERLGLPFVTHRATAPETAKALRETLHEMGCHDTPQHTEDQGRDG